MERTVAKRRIIVTDKRLDLDDMPRPKFNSGRNLCARVGHHRPQLLAGLEDRNGTRGNFDGITSSRVTRHARLPLADLKGPKPAYLNVMLLSQRGSDGVEKRVDDARTVLFRNEGTSGASDLRGDFFDQIGLRHWAPRNCWCIAGL